MRTLREYTELQTESEIEVYHWLTTRMHAWSQLQKCFIYYVIVHERELTSLKKNDCNISDNVVKIFYAVACLYAGTQTRTRVFFRVRPDHKQAYIRF